jgi:hypothetical protein
MKRKHITESAHYESRRTHGSYLLLFRCRRRSNKLSPHKVVLFWLPRLASSLQFHSAVPASNVIGIEARGVHPFHQNARRHNSGMACGLVIMFLRISFCDREQHQLTNASKTLGREFMFVVFVSYSTELIEAELRGRTAFWTCSTFI